MTPTIPTITIDENDIKVVFTRSSGPGGQHVNKTSTAVQLRFNVYGDTNLSKDVRRRLIQMAKNRMTAGGILVIDARRFRSQRRNREDARSRLEALIERASHTPTRRKKTHPGKMTRLRRLEAKQRRSRLKKQRRSVNNDDE